MVQGDLFREVTRRICGSLHFEEALQDTYAYLKQILKLDAIFITRYEFANRRARLIAGAHDQAGFLLDEDLTLSKSAWHAIDQWLASASDHPKPWIRDNTHPINKEILKHITNHIPEERRHEIKKFSSLTCVLKVKDTVIGNLTFCATGDFQYNEDHAKIIYEINEPFAIALSNALSYMELMMSHKALQADERNVSGDVLIGANAGLLEVKRLIDQVAPKESHVLILGETGVGKEVVATEIHNNSGRAEGPFIKLNCGAIPESLIDSELFGHEKGAFTGAHKTLLGRFERANQGTLFLDEIAELPLQAQVKLLRVIQSGEFERVGGAEMRSTDVRIIAATHRDLQSMISEKVFRSDLWYRLNVFPIFVPPLRDRKQDIPELANYLVRRKCTEMNMKFVPEITKEAIGKLMAYDWPGNIRELQNFIERSLILSKGPVLQISDIEGSGTSEQPQQNRKPKEFQTLEELEASHITKVLKKVQGKISGKQGAAEVLGIHPNTLRSRMQKLGIPMATGKL